MKPIKVKIGPRNFEPNFKNHIGPSSLYCILSEDPSYNGILLGPTKEEALEALRSWNKLRHYDGYPQIEVIDE